MSMEQSNHVSIPSLYSSHSSQGATESKLTELTLVKEELRLALEKLRVTQEELHKKNQILESSYQAIERERQRLQATYQKIRKQATSLNVTTDITNHKQSKVQINCTQSLEGIFASRIIHDLNNILSPILTVAQLLQQLHQPDLSEQSQEMLKILENSARRGTNLTKQILTYTRESHNEHNSIQIASLLKELIDTVQLTFQKSIHIDHHVSDHPLWLVSADSTQLYQVLTNLCVNARDAMPEGGVLSISAENCFIDQAFTFRNSNAQMGNHVVITIADTGTGIPPEVRDRIFEPFFTTKPTGQGTGLGLTTVLKIVKTHGGFLHIFSEVEQGTSVKVYLPALKELECSY